MNSFSSMADRLVELSMTHDLPKSLSNEISTLIHKLYLQATICDQIKSTRKLALRVTFCNEQIN